MNPNNMLLSSNGINKFVVNLPARLQPTSRNVLFSNKSHQSPKNKMYIQLQKRIREAHHESPPPFGKSTLRVQSISSEKSEQLSESLNIKNKLHKNVQKDMKITSKLPFRDKKLPKPLKRKIPQYFSVEAKNITAIHSVHIREPNQDSLNPIIHHRSDDKVISLAIELKALFNTRGKLSILKKIQDWTERQVQENQTKIKASGIKISSVFKEKLKPTLSHNMRYTSRKRTNTYSCQSKVQKERKKVKMMHHSMQSDIEWDGIEDPVSDWYNSTFSISLC